MKIKKNELVLLLGERSYLAKAGSIFETKLGKADLRKLAGKPLGSKVKAERGEFVALKPSVSDFLKIAKRLPQVILPKDAALMLAITGVGRDSIAVDGGSGSGFLAIFLSNYVKKVYTYENRKEFFELARKNIRKFGAKNIAIKNADVKNFKERGLDLITLDLQDAEKIVKRAYAALNPGGWLVVYYPNFDQVMHVSKEIKGAGFSDTLIYENFVREWSLTKPKREMLSHTGFLVFARKVGK